MAQCGGESSLPDRITLQQARGAKQPERAAAGPVGTRVGEWSFIAMRAVQSDPSLSWCRFDPTERWPMIDPAKNRPPGQCRTLRVFDRGCFDRSRGFLQQR